MSTKEAKGERGEGKFISLPLVESIKKKADRLKSIDLLDEAHLLKSTIERQNARLDKIKDELLMIQEEYQLPGFRNGNLCFSASFQEGRRQLNKDLLIENGVGPDIIQASYKQGEGFWKKDLKRLGE